MRADRVRTHAVDDDIDRKITPMILPPTRHEGEAVDTDDIPSRDDHESVGTLEHPEGSIVTVGTPSSFFQGRGGNVNDAVAGAQTQCADDRFDARTTDFGPREAVRARMDRPEAWTGIPRRCAIVGLAVSASTRRVGALRARLAARPHAMVVRPGAPLVPHTATTVPGDEGGGGGGGCSSDTAV